jgi:hypothetical protein
LSKNCRRLSAAGHAGPTRQDYHRIQKPVIAPRNKNFLKNPIKPPFVTKTRFFLFFRFGFRHSNFDFPPSALSARKPPGFFLVLLPFVSGQPELLSPYEKIHR